MNDLINSLNINTLSQLQFLVAIYNLGMINASEVASIIDQLMNEGIYLDDFLDVIYANPLRYNDAILVLEKTIAHFNITIPDKEKSTRIIITHYINIIANHSSDPFSLFSNLITDIHSVPFTGIEQSYELYPLLCLYWEYEDIRDAPNEFSSGGKPRSDYIEELKTKAVFLAKKWLTCHNSV